MASVLAGSGATVPWLPRMVTLNGYPAIALRPYVPYVPSVTSGHGRLFGSTTLYSIGDKSDHTFGSTTLYSIGDKSDNTARIVTYTGSWVLATKLQQ